LTPTTAARVNEALPDAVVDEVRDDDPIELFAGPEPVANH
jgi:hypothetical protein